ncbi:hypothetical protein H0N96_03655 [Candidatus Micrarchaeota archaeon]|nr:hypothetical protein [Candidatus Micrarchaeota archaeon]
MGVKSILVFFLGLLLLLMLLGFLSVTTPPAPQQNSKQSPSEQGSASPSEQPSNHLSPARDLTGRWTGSASFQENVEGAECLFGGDFILTLQQDGNSVYGDFEFTETSLKQTRVQTESSIPSIGCYHPVEGVTSGQFSGSVSSSAVELNVGGRRQFSGSFTTDLMSLKLETCLVQDAPCTVADAAKWKISLTRQS